MNKIEYEIYEAIKDCFYKILDKNQHKILKKIPYQYKDMFCGNILLDNRIFDLVPYANDLHEEFINELIEQYCYGNKNFRTAKHLPSDSKVFLRGVTIPKKSYLKLLGSKIFTFHRDGAYGRGQYFTLDKTMALSYAKYREKNILQATIDDKAKQITESEVDNMIYNFVTELMECEDDYDSVVIQFIRNEHYQPYMKSIFAGAHGYDIIDNANKDYTGSVFCVLNPEKITFLSNEK